MERQFFDVLRSEGVIRNEPATSIQSDEHSIYGRLILTSKCLYFARSIVNTSGFTRYFIGDQKLEAVIKIDLDTITAITRETYVVDHNVVSIRYMQTEAVRFSVISYTDWERDIEAARMNSDIPGDPNRKREAA